MAIKVGISEPTLLEELMSALLRNGCIAQRVAADTCLVIHVQAGNEDEARQELDFFVRAWQLRHPTISAFVTA